VREKCGFDVLGIGLWLASSAAEELRNTNGASALRRHLEAQGIEVVTLNGFPYGDFHADIVKQAVYQPDWSDPRRLAYTIQLAELLSELVPEGTTEASISTLPIGWREATDSQAVAEAGKQLRQLVQVLHQLHENTGVLVHVDLEPEPGCHFDTAQGAVAFFEEHLPEEHHRRHLGICHDICHSAVMFEPQTAALRTYRQHGINVGKIQVSSAIEVDFDSVDDPERSLAAYRTFIEPRYLHQTVIQENGTQRFFDDLPDALAHCEASGTWRTHFHVPIFSIGTDAWSSSQAEIERCLAALPREEPLPTLEVETYAWNVLPSCLYEGGELAKGIAEEMRWLQTLMSRIRPEENFRT
jgi:sugar phosphate isomerase/epimerase